MTDTISDMLTRIRNAHRARHKIVPIPYSNMKKGILQIMLEEGYIKGFEEKKIGSRGQFTELQVALKYSKDKSSAINEVQRVSTPGRRVYSQSSELKGHYNRLGTVILSTSKGIMSDRKAKELNVGGEIICKIF